VTGLDPVQAMVDLAREGASGAEFFAGGADGLAQAGECDAIIALNVLAYMTDDEIETFWSGVAETLAPGGAFLVGVPPFRWTGVDHAASMAGELVVDMI
jgi:trans-aconitate methyltransferase